MKKGSCTFAVLLYVGAFESSFNHVSLLDKFCIMTTNEIIFLIKKHDSLKIPEKNLSFFCVIFERENKNTFVRDEETNT